MHKFSFERDWPRVGFGLAASRVLPKRVWPDKSITAYIDV